MNYVKSPLTIELEISRNKGQKKNEYKFYPQKGHQGLSHPVLMTLIHFGKIYIIQIKDYFYPLSVAPPPHPLNKIITFFKQKLDMFYICFLLCYGQIQAKHYQICIQNGQTSLKRYTNVTKTLSTLHMRGPPPPGRQKSKIVFKPNSFCLQKRVHLKKKYSTCNKTQWKPI